MKNFNILCSLLQNGAIPKHIGIIMDGNRRYARRNNMDTREGHARGFSTMMDLCQWALILGVKIITVYAFSIENFKRPKEEVDYLMELANQKFSEMIEKSHKLQKLGVRIRVVGDFSPIPEKTKAILAKAVKATENNTGALLNVCISYTSHEEILHSMRRLSKGVLEDHLITSHDIDKTLFEQCMYIKEDLDILIRTSGEYRLSDFMLWQSTFCNSNFLKVLWPDFSFFHFFYIVFLYQSNYIYLREKINNQLNYSQNIQCNNNPNNSNSNSNSSSNGSEDHNEETLRRKRVETFLQYIKEMDIKTFDEMEHSYPLNT
ncbi:Dehydrodolichyl diphosphate synthase [Tieghemostelium lacteum]|uniref:Alkyl transferase n=1 Tax=Tieghemostelium lacteum TaxID=361077 RepID=A0A152A8U5_TIELA|nr:Dehydrodolichyl diphosphate synthase [Tieghemostelium lacteum]|eukprot:KYR02642.1 Dehydrodolichyl diphosphate synthase [Tieghemostelium lacteum]